MWTLGYDDSGEITIPEPFNGRKLRPLIPRTMPSLTSHGTNFCSQYYHLASFLNEQSKRESDGSPPVVVTSSRWNPTPEQLRILEELYRRGTRTPSADQIQHITAQLRRYGKIEGKNVFYWFQNHKARERQKRRRQTADTAADDRPRDIKPSEKIDSEAAREVYKIEQNQKNWAGLSKNYSSTIAEECVQTQRMAKAGAAAPAATEPSQKQGSDSVGRNTEWHFMMSQLGNPRRKTTTATMGCGCNPMRTQDLNSFVETYREESDETEGGRRSTVVPDDKEDGCEEFQTLQLFPLRSSKSCKHNAKLNEFNTSVSNMRNSICTPSFQFFEFLPLKN